MRVSDFDQWRERYDRLCYADQLEFYNQVETDHPLQHGYDIEKFSRFFTKILATSGELTVLEVGGWKGELAKEALEKYEQIRQWVNYEISAEAVKKSVCNDWRYVPLIPANFVWNIPLVEADVFISSHFIEHIRASQLEMLFNNLPSSIKYIIIQAPLADEPTDWNGYFGTHILEVGWAGVNEMLDKLGFKLAEILGQEIRYFKK